MKSFWLFLIFICLSLSFFNQLYLHARHQSYQHQMTFSTDEIRRYHALTNQLRQAQDINANLMSQITTLQYRQTHPKLTPNEASAHKYLQALTHSVPLSGDGLEIVLHDARSHSFSGLNPNRGIVHNTDLLMVVNELWQAQAKGVAINNEPLGVQSAIECTGPLIHINQSLIAPPFVIHAVGQPDLLLNQLQRPHSSINDLKRYGIQVTITPKRVTIPASRHVISPFSPSKGVLSSV